MYNNMTVWSVAVLGFENWVDHCMATIICEHFSSNRASTKKAKGLHLHILIKVLAHTLKRSYNHGLKQ